MPNLLVGTFELSHILVFAFSLIAGTRDRKWRVRFENGCVAGSWSIGLGRRHLNSLQIHGQLWYRHTRDEKWTLTLNEMDEPVSKQWCRSRFSASVPTRPLPIDILAWESMITHVIIKCGRFPLLMKIDLVSVRQHSSNRVKSAVKGISKVSSGRNIDAVQVTAAVRILGTETHRSFSSTLDSGLRSSRVSV